MPAAVLWCRFQQLVAEGMRPDTSTFNVLLKACMRSKDARRAELTLRWMRKARMRGDETTYNTLIKVRGASMHAAGQDRERE